MEGVSLVVDLVVLVWLGAVLGVLATRYLPLPEWLVTVCMNLFFVGIALIVLLASALKLLRMEE